MNSLKTLARGIAAALGIALAAGAAQAQTVGTTFPSGFFASADASTTLLWIGFGGDKSVNPVTRTPVIILHGNDGTPYPTGCERFSMNVQGFANHLLANGYAPSEVWALGWQGTQCDQTTMGWNKSASEPHTIAANVPDLRAFVAEVLRYTGASRVDIVAHGAGAVLAREWVRQDSSRRLVRRFVAIDAPNQGMGMCEIPGTQGYTGWGQAFSGGFTFDSPVCQELGSPNTPFLTTLNKASDGGRISPADTLVIRNGEQSFPYMTARDGLTQGAYPYDIYGNPVDLSDSTTVRGGQTITLYSQAGYGAPTAHVGIANSPDTRDAALKWLSKRQ